jgi:hypothetical protein
VQSGLLDPLPLPTVAMFRQGLRESLDRGVPDIVGRIEDIGTLDEARKHAIREALRKYIQTLTPQTAAPKVAGLP